MQWDRDSLVKMCVEVNSCHMHPKINTFYHVIEQWETKASHGLLGYRAIWHILRRDYGLKVKRYVWTQRYAFTLYAVVCNLIE